MAKVSFVAITDGRRDYLLRTLKSADHLLCDWHAQYIINDSGDSEYGQWLAATFPQFVIVHHAQRLGLAAAVKSAWTLALAGGADYLWHAEDDMVYNTEVVVDTLAGMLAANPTLAQLSLKRQPVGPHEEAAGGFIELHPQDFVDADGYVAHSTLFTFNPCLIPAAAMQVCCNSTHDWLERGVTDTLLANGWHFGIVGAKADPPRVEHIGHVRSSGWQL